MSGILEQILHELATIRTDIAALRNSGTLPQPTPGQLPPSQAPVGGYAQAPVQQHTPPAQSASNVTAESITALIEPHIGNERIKAALGAAMRGMGINALPETQPHQFAALYAAFQNVIAQHTQGGQTPPAAMATSII